MIYVDNCSLLHLINDNEYYYRGLYNDTRELLGKKLTKTDYTIDLELEMLAFSLVYGL